MESAYGAPNVCKTIRFTNAIARAQNIGAPQLSPVSRRRRYTYFISAANDRNGQWKWKYLPINKFLMRSSTTDRSHGAYTAPNESTECQKDDIVLCR